MKRLSVLVAAVGVSAVYFPSLLPLAVTVLVAAAAAAVTAKVLACPRRPVPVVAYSWRWRVVGLHVASR